MYSSASRIPICFPSKLRFCCFHGVKFNLLSRTIIIRRPTNHRAHLSVSASIAKKDEAVSWVSADQNGPDDFNGWAVVEAPVNPSKKGKGAALVIVSVAAAVLLGVIAFFTLTRKGYKFRFGVQGTLVHSQTEANDSEIEAAESDLSEDKLEDPVVSEESVSETGNHNVPIESKHNKLQLQNPRWNMVPVAVDASQQEALLILKKLKIIEENVKADELCSRREFARWLVRANSRLERSSDHRIVSSAALSGSTVAAFDDMDVEDPDFIGIQCLAEAGIVASKLSDSKDSDTDRDVYFLPERYISRQDLISWKAKLEYGAMRRLRGEVSRKNIPFLDARVISSEAVADIFLDILADEKSILRRVFGQIKRLQPSKPSTKAQAAIALTSGRMEDFMRAELSRLDSEYASREIAMQEIKSQLLERGTIQRYWEGKMEEERNHGLEVEKFYLAAIHDLEQEKAVHENSLAELLKQKAALDCQKQLLSSLKQEVEQMSEQLELEKAEFVDERSSLESKRHDLQAKYERLVEAKSILEAEIEALRILRSWVNDEAEKSISRAKVLEEAGKRWRWDQKDNAADD